jgi:hypothetical protein
LSVGEKPKMCSETNDHEDTSQINKKECKKEKNTFAKDFIAD